MKHYHPHFNSIMADHLTSQVKRVKELHAIYKAALLTEDEETLRLLDDSIAFEEEFLKELYEVL